MAGTSLHFLLAGCQLVPGDRRHAEDEIGQSRRRVEPAQRSRRRGHARDALRRPSERHNFSRQPFGSESLLDQPKRSAGIIENAGIGELILIDRVRQRYKDGRPADRGQFGNRRSAGARHDKMARRDARRQVGKERRHLRGN